MIPASLIALIIGLFIAWFFNSLIGILGISFILTFYWIVYLRDLKSSRRMILPFKEQIVNHFEDFKGKSGNEHFGYVYENVQFFLTARSARLFARINDIIKWGCMIIGLYSIWLKDWYSVIFCIIIVSIISILSPFFNKPLKELRASKNDLPKFTTIADSIESYTDFFVNHFPQMIHENFKRDHPDFPKFNP